MRPASVPALRARHNDDIAHSGHVCRLATRLFVGALETHGLSPLHLPLLQAGALLHNVGLEDDPPNHHIRGRDIVMAEGLRGRTEGEKRVIACLVAFHRKTVEPQQEPLWRELSPDLQTTTLSLAALLRVADGLDYTQSQMTRILAFRGRGRLRIVVAGVAGDVEVDVARAERKCDLWSACIGHRPVFQIEEGETETWWPPVRPDDTLAASATSVLRFHLSEFIAFMPGFCSINAIEQRHKMRVSLRRFRAALRFYRRMWNQDEYDDLVRGLRWFGGLLGAVRDRDISITWLEAALSEVPEEVRPAIACLRTQQSRARRAELKMLVKAFREEHFAELLRRAVAWTESKDLTLWAERPLAGDISRVFRRRARRIRAFDGTFGERDGERLHALRRECRRLRYGAEAWYRALGTGRKQLVRSLTLAQGALGDVHDADVRLALWPDAADETALRTLHERVAVERSEGWEVFRQTWPKLLKSLRNRRLNRVVRPA